MEKQQPNKILNAFCVDWEEWFHIGGLHNPYAEPHTWDRAKPMVEADTDVLLDMFEQHGVKATFLCVGWVAKKYPQVVQKMVARGHEIGSHSYFHEMVWTMTPEQFKKDVSDTRKLLQDISGQPVLAYRAPCFSMKRECFWAYPILAEAGYTIDVSLVPAPRDNGGVIGFQRDPLKLVMDEGEMTVYPVSVVSVAGRASQFSGGGHMRALPTWMIDFGFRQNHQAKRPVMAYIHPREINPDQPRIDKIPLRKKFTHYYGLNTVQRKLHHMMHRYPFSTLSEVVAGMQNLPEHRLVNGEFVTAAGLPQLLKH